MAMTKVDAESIVNLICNDADSIKRIDSNIDGVLPDSWGISGSLRNWGYVLGGMATFGYWGDPTEEEFADRVCTGIADATSQAINRAIKAVDPKLRSIKKATTVSRNRLGTAHTATVVIMIDDAEHVFDWHATLSAENPLMFRYVRDWKGDKNGETYDGFEGWK